MNRKVLKKGSLSFFVGPSYAYGKNSYIVELVLAPPPPFGLGDIIHKKNIKVYEGYWGAAGGIGYDHYIFKDRVNIGAEVLSRYYTRDFPFSVHYGFHFGYNF